MHVAAREKRKMMDPSYYEAMPLDFQIDKDYNEKRREKTRRTSARKQERRTRMGADGNVLSIGY